MDFMKWLSSFDELLYEVISWLVFFPLTLWRVCRRPMAMMDYADRQLRLPEPEQYADALSPPLFLALSLGLAHLCATAFGEADDLVANRHGLAGLIIDAGHASRLIGQQRFDHAPFEVSQIVSTHAKPEPSLQRLGKDFDGGRPYFALDRRGQRDGIGRRITTVILSLWLRCGFDPLPLASHLWVHDLSFVGRNFRFCCLFGRCQVVDRLP